MLQCRGSIAQAAVVVALLWSRPAGAQVGVVPRDPLESGGLVNRVVTGVQYDIANQAKAEHRLNHLQAKFRRDTERGNSDAMGRDAGRIDKVRYRIAVDDWLIRKNSLQDPCYYPFHRQVIPWGGYIPACCPRQAP
jgi:hypothetical protein